LQLKVFKLKIRKYNEANNCEESILYLQLSPVVYPIPG